MFKTTDLTVGDLVASLSGTVVSVKPLAASLNGSKMMSLTVHDWNTDSDKTYVVTANNEYEVWE